jgi:chromatin structure-remodeling complex subunit RSC1/2
MGTSGDGRADSSGSPFAALHTIPVNAADKVPFLSYTAPLDMAAIETKIDDYRSLSDFDVDMIRLFERAGRWYAEQTSEYGQILLLQRLYQSLTGTAQATDAKHNYASIEAGPGRASDNDAEDPILTREPGYTERKYTSSARWKGLEYKVGDWVHLANPDDPKRPIVGQIWKTYIPTTKGRRTHHVSVAWYYRPEQVSDVWK